MKGRTSIRTSHRAQSGYALLMIMFMLAMLVIGMAAAAPTILSSIQREREKEMVWRGKQYTRGIRLYYLKLNRFPTSLDDLTKPKTGIRFMRQAYKDPMNLADGSWRLIYVGPNGQLIGSLNNRSISLSGGGTAPMGSSGIGGGLFSSNNGLNSSSASGFGSSIGSAQQGTAIGAVNTAVASANGTTAQGPPGQPGQPEGQGQNNSSFEDPLQPHSLAGPMDASNTIGGNIIGVGSKINKNSFLIYEKAKNYKYFEFIWDPSKDTAGSASAGIGTPVNNGNGINGMNGANPNSPTGSSTIGSPFSSGSSPAGQNPGMGQNPSGMNPGPSPDPNQVPPLQAPPNP